MYLISKKNVSYVLLVIDYFRSIFYNTRSAQSLPRAAKPSAAENAAPKVPENAPASAPTSANTAASTSASTAPPVTASQPPTSVRSPAVPPKPTNLPIVPQQIGAKEFNLSSPSGTKAMSPSHLAQLSPPLKSTNTTPTSQMPNFLLSQLSNNATATSNTTNFSAPNKSANVPPQSTPKVIIFVLSVHVANIFNIYCAEAYLWLDRV